MGSTIYTYTFPFKDADSQMKIRKAIAHYIPVSLFSQRMEKHLESERAYLLTQRNNYLEMLLPIPDISEENDLSLMESAERYAIFVTVQRTNVARDDEEIAVQGRIIRAESGEYEQLLDTGSSRGLLSLAAQISLQESEADYSESLYPHRKMTHKPRSFSETTKRAAHRNEVMQNLGRIIGRWLWQTYARNLTDQLDLPHDAGLLFYIAQTNTRDSEFPNTQYVATYKDLCLIVCEELEYPTDTEAVPRYAVIPASTFEFDLARGIGAAKELGFAFLNSPGISNYMRMRPNLSGPVGIAAGAAVREALQNAKSRFE